MGWEIPLVAAAGAFFVVMVARIWPSFQSRPPLRVALKDARERIEAAKDDKTKALALCDAADACALALGRGGSAVGYYLRAMRCDPSSAAIVKRAARGLERRPRDLEALLWRRLASAEWTGARATLEELVNLYENRLKNAHRARALKHAMRALRG